MERKRSAHGSDRAVAAGQRTDPSNLAKVGVAGSSPVVRSRETSCGAVQTARGPSGSRLVHDFVIEPLTHSEGHCTSLEDLAAAN
jgi:hypothetical protein